MEVVSEPSMISILVLFILGLFSLGGAPTLLPALIFYFFGFSVAATPVMEQPAYQAESTHKKGPAVVLPAEPISP